MSTTELYSALFTLQDSTLVHSIRYWCDSEEEMRAHVHELHPNTDYIISIEVVPYNYY